MATLLEGVNKVLKRVTVIKSDLSSLTDSANQNFVDSCVDMWNETIDELYDLTPFTRPNALKYSTITLSAAREYSIHSNAQALRFDYHLIEESEDHIITLVPDGHKSMIFQDLGQDDTGLPHFATLNPENGRLLMDRTPSTDDIGRVYKYRYEKDLELDEAEDEFPFKVRVFRALVPAVAEKWKFEHQKNASQEVFNDHLARAAGFLRQAPARTHYGYAHQSHNMMDPFDAASVR